MGPHLPAEPIEAIGRRLPLSYRGRGLHFEWSRLDKRVFLRVRILGPGDTLTRREREAAQLLIAGKSHKEIARELGLEPNTVRTHIVTIYRKLDVSNKAQMIRSLNGTG